MSRVANVVVFIYVENPTAPLKPLLKLMKLSLEFMVGKPVQLDFTKSWVHRNRLGKKERIVVAKVSFEGDPLIPYTVLQSLQEVLSQLLRGCRLGNSGVKAFFDYSYTDDEALRENFQPAGETISQFS